MSDCGTIVIYTTFPSAAEAQAFGKLLIEARLAACVNIFPGMTAILEWQGALETVEESAMIIKTRDGLQDLVLEELKKRHSYSLPVFLVLPVQDGSPDFLAWIKEQTTRAA